MTRQFLYKIFHNFGAIMDITIGQNRRGYVMFDSQTDALAAKMALEEIAIKQQNSENGPLYERDIKINWSNTSRYPQENEQLNNGTHEHITKRYILSGTRANRNDLLIDYRSPVKSEEKALNLLRDYFPNEEFNTIKKKSA